MEIIHTIAALRERTDAWRTKGLRQALAPTMGNLHAGHLDLVVAARKTADRVVASIFVNPTQFGPGEDFETYPRTLEADSAQLRMAGVDLLFAPSLDEMYPHGRKTLTVVDMPTLSRLLCGRHRPGHFPGVVTIVSKLFNLCSPDVALFGEKDFQQLVLVRQLVQDLDFAVEIQSVPIRREQDGLAMSSRNRYLSSEERRQAPRLYETLRELAARIRAGDHQYAGLEQLGEDSLRKAGFRPDYVAIRSTADLLPPSFWEEQTKEDLVVLAAACLGKARLIDNIRA